MAKRRPDSDLPRTVAEFDVWNAGRPERWEFIAGRPVMMAPASMPHTIIKGNVFAALRSKLAGSPCRPFVDGAEVKSRDLCAIPDVVVSCGPVDLSSPTISEPTVIVEILSPRTERDDTHRKWQGYCLILSVEHYLVVAQDSGFVTLHTRTGPASFAETMYRDGAVDLLALGVALSLDEIYEGVIFPESAADG
jgi:Uma2 family endonuclease